MLQLKNSLKRFTLSEAATVSNVSTNQEQQGGDPQLQEPEDYDQVAGFDPLHPDNHSSDDDQHDGEGDIPDQEDRYIYLPG